MLIQPKTNGVAGVYLISVILNLDVGLFLTFISVVVIVSSEESEPITKLNRLQTLNTKSLPERVEERTFLLHGMTMCGIGEMIDEDSLVMDLFSEAATVEVDVKGRITIPETHMKEMEFEGEVLIIGMGKHVEIWKEETFNEYKNKSQKAVQMVKDADALMREAHIMKRISDANALKKSTEG